MMASMTTIQFLKDWRYEQHGSIERGGQLKVDYDKRRLPRCFTMWRGAEFGDIVAYLRFHPRGEIVRGRVVAPVHDRENSLGIVIGHVPVPLEWPIPSDATQVEI